MSGRAGAGVTRRGVLQAIGALAGIAGSSAALPGLAAQTAAQTAAGAADSAARRRAAAGRLADPTIAGRPRDRTSAADNDAAIQALEKRLRCGCGCTLDVYTCRTTDFTCTYSPQLHREVVALWDGGKSADEIVEAFVAKYGEEALMAPEPEGFNLAGYLVPGVVITGLGATLLWVLSRRARVAAEGAGTGIIAPGMTGVAGTAEAAGWGGAAGGGTSGAGVAGGGTSGAGTGTPAIGTPTGPGTSSADSATPATFAAPNPAVSALSPEDLALLEQALAEEDR